VAGKRLLTKEQIHRSISSRKKIEKAFVLFSVASLMLVLTTLLLLLWSVVEKGIKWLSLNFLLSPPSRFPEKAGIYPALVGSLWLVALTMLFAIPIGIAAAIYLEEYSRKNRIASIIDLSISNLAGIPSIVYGIFGLSFFVRFFGFGRSILSGALTMSLLILPIIIISTREALKAVPRSLRETAYSLGATRWQTVRYVVLPSAFSWILTGVILAVARALGETAPLITIGALAFVVYTPRSVFDPFTALTIQIYSWISRPKVEFQELAAAAIVVLLLLFLLTVSFAFILRYRSQKKYRV
jgi:phosphate transport system permease protein